MIFALITTAICISGKFGIPTIQQRTVYLLQGMAIGALILNSVSIVFGLYK